MQYPRKMSIYNLYKYKKHNIWNAERRLFIRYCMIYKSIIFWPCFLCQNKNTYQHYQCGSISVQTQSEQIWTTYLLNKLNCGILLKLRDKVVGGLGGIFGRGLILFIFDIGWIIFGVDWDIFGNGGVIFCTGEDTVGADTVVVGAVIVGAEVEVVGFSLEGLCLFHPDLLLRLRLILVSSSGSFRFFLFLKLSIFTSDLWISLCLNALILFIWFTNSVCLLALLIFTPSLWWYLFRFNCIDWIDCNLLYCDLPITNPTFSKYAFQNIPIPWFLIYTTLPTIPLTIFRFGGRVCLHTRPETMECAD